MAEARYWREIPQRYRMEAKKCDKCGKIFFPPRLICSKCKATEFSDVTLANEGEVVSFTVIHTPPAQFSSESPYVMAIVRLTDGVALTAQVADCGEDDLKIGSKVKILFRKIREEGEHGIKCYGYKFALV
ncbi:Zn-ribbon domain-containing OB-fold protein [Candidatus Riflebacteria bacterium]